jgi:hypothetical protein
VNKQIELLWILFSKAIIPTRSSTFVLGMKGVRGVKKEEGRARG